MKVTADSLPANGDSERDALRYAESLVERGCYDVVVLFPKCFAEKLQQLREKAGDAVVGETESSCLRHRSLPIHTRQISHWPKSRPKRVESMA